ncbi:HTH_Tnp_Tc3_2 domain-containing protein, partial [Trichonephila clavipes]
AVSVTEPDKIGNVIVEVIDLSRQMYLKDYSDDVHEFLHSFNQELTVEELIEMHEQVYCQKKQTEHSIKPGSSATGTTVSRQTVYRRLGHIGLYARRPVRCVPLTTTPCRLRLTWIREHALWKPQHLSCVMFTDESRFSLQSDSRRTLIWRAPGTRYHQENTTERHRYGGAG